MKTTTTSIPALNRRKHFKILDGLRGLAAISVVIFHFMEFVKPDYKDNFIAHSYLAVDFFFCLSGFVIAYAYDSRIKDIGIITFLKLRLIRLHPMVIFGAIIGVLAFVFDPYSNLFNVYGSKETVLMFFSSCFMIPYAVVQERYFNIFHLNPPTWSLFWEYVANIAYVLVLFRLKKYTLLIATIFAAIILVYASYDGNYLGIGWSGNNFLGGGARILFSFLAGMLVYRSNFIIKNKLGFPLLCVLLFLAFIFPFIENLNWIIDPIIVIFYFPVIIALGAGATLHKSLEKTCDWSGEISYPLYMVHYPFLWMFYSAIEAHKIPENYMTLIVIFGTIALIIFAHAIMVYIDRPIRKMLRKQVKKKQSHLVLAKQ
ncbi:acyltransferase family protein [Zhouia sp. PK063]|uniref:acyltransferase family protein n=1 Tax=Zhouia sp. PK063 TaxID=3373602 RepID=UPI003789C3E3